MDWLIVFLLIVIAILLFFVWKFSRNEYRHPKGAKDSEGNPMGGKYKKAGE